MLGITGLKPCVIEIRIIQDICKKFTEIKFSVGLAVMLDIATPKVHLSIQIVVQIDT